MLYTPSFGIHQGPGKRPSGPNRLKAVWRRLTLLGYLPACNE